MGSPNLKENVIYVYTNKKTVILRHILNVTKHACKHTIILAAFSGAATLHLGAGVRA